MSDLTENPQEVKNAAYYRRQVKKLEEELKGWYSYADGEPCQHRGCLNHVTHPCEGCGRIAGIQQYIR